MIANARSDFNSHARVGRDGGGGQNSACSHHFNSHARVGRDTLNFAKYRRSSYFNSHARVGRDISSLDGGLMSRISTHTPAWGVTDPVLIDNDLIDISTHTPAWGVTIGSAGKNDN